MWSRLHPFAAEKNIGLDPHLEDSLYPDLEVLFQPGFIGTIYKG